MSNEVTKRMIAAYLQQSMVTRFLSGFFQSPPENFYNSKEVEIDIEREDEDIAIVVTDLSTGYRMNSDDLYTNKSFIAPALKEAGPINAYDLMKRNPGEDPFVNPEFQANATLRAFKLFRKLEKKIRRTIELQAAQVLTTGTITLSDDNGTALYTVDFKPKATHFPTASTGWDAAGGDPLGDILALANVIRNDGLADPDQLIMGEGSFEAAMKNADVIQRYDTRRADLGTVAPMEMRGEGGQYRGTLEIGNYRYDLWTYGGRYKDPQTGNKVKYIPNDKVVVRSSSGRMDATFGAIPRIVPPDSRVMPFLPPRISDTAGGIDMFTNAWVTPNGEELFVGAGARPLMIPTAIDTYGCLDTNLS